jgi:hypothetical protein
MSEKRESTIKLIQNNTGKILSINISQEGIKKPNNPTGLGLWWQHPVSKQWIQNARRAKDPSHIVEIANYYHTQGTLTIDTYYRPRAECNFRDVEYTGFGTNINDSGELRIDQKILIYKSQLEQYFKNLISIKTPNTQKNENQILFNFRNVIGSDPLFIQAKKLNITIFYIAIKGYCGDVNIIPLDFSKIK